MHKKKASVSTVRLTALCQSLHTVCNGVFTLSDTENENDTDTENDKNGFHCNMQKSSHCTNTDNDNDLFNDMNGFQGHFFARFCTDNMKNTSCNANFPVFCSFFFFF